MTCPVELTLECDGITSLVLTDDEAFVYVDLDLGYPTPRPETDERTDQSGVDDGTELWGASAVSLSLVLQQGVSRSVEASVNRLKAFAHPGRRPRLRYVLTDDITERYVELRATSMSAPLQAPFWNEIRRVQLAWDNPDGVQYDVVLQQQTVAASADVEEGRAYSLVYPRVYPASTPVGATMIETPSADDGAVAIPPVILLYGPCDDPRVECIDTDQRIEFSGLSLAAGEYVEINVRERTVYLNSDTAESRYNLIDFATSEWFELQPGGCLVRYYPVSFTAGAAAVIIWRPAYL